MKVFLLEHPRHIAPDRCNDIANAPLASSLVTASIAGTLESRSHRTVIAEGFLDGLTYDEIERMITGFCPDAIGVHLVYNWERHDALFTFLRQIKQANPKLRLTGYGYYPTFAWREILEACPDFEGLILGEPELTFTEWLESDGPVTGMAWRDSRNEWHSTRRPPIKDPDMLPDPVRSPAMMQMGEVNIEGSRGCYGRCTFCYINAYYGEDSCWRPKTPERIIREIDAVIAVHGRRKFYFTDPNFFGPGRRGRERVLALAELLKKRGVRFGIEGRVNDIHPETISALVDAGLEDMLIGLESGSDRSLRRLNKLATVTQNEQALAILREHGIEPNIGFIMFEPESTLEDLRVNLEFLKRNRLLDNLFITANVLYHPQIILQGTTAYRELERAGRLKLKNTSYEAETDFTVPETARLARVMARVTNHCFQRLDEVWRKQVSEPAGAGDAYAMVNGILTGCFDRTLARLETGAPADEEAAIMEATDAITAVFDIFPRAESLEPVNEKKRQGGKTC